MCKLCYNVSAIAKNIFLLELHRSEPQCVYVCVCICVCVCSGLVPHVLGEVLFLWCCNLLCHFINTYAADENVSVFPSLTTTTDTL